MKKENVNYGNWVSNSKIYIGVLFLITPIIISLLIPWFVAKLILYIISGIIILPFIYMIGLYYYFSKDNGEIQNKIRNIVIKRLNFDGNGKVLDIGTGAGPLAIGLAKKYPNSKTIGIDYWGKLWNYSLKLCIKNATMENVDDRVEFRRANASKLNFNNEEFDAIVSNYVFHEVRDTKNKIDVLKEAFRVLKKGGVFSLQDLFGNRKKFGTINDLIEIIKSWNVEEIKYEKAIDIYQIPKIIRNELNKTYVIYGKK